MTLNGVMARYDRKLKTVGFICYHVKLAETRSVLLASKM